VNEALAVTRVVNASVLLELPGGALLTDPYFQDHWFLRFGEPIGLRVADLHRLAAVLGGHGVFDHWQPRSLQGYPNAPTTPVLVASPRMVRSARRAGFSRADVLSWGETRTVGDGITVTSVPGERVAGMTTNSYVIASGDTTVFVGTEARGLSAIRAVARSRRVDVAVLPIDGLRVLGYRLVMDARGALDAAELLGARTLIPIHYTQRPIPALLQCPSGLADLARHAATSAVAVQVCPAGVRTIVGDPVSRTRTP
jgi:L-ascorbate metabolism protein UlaG (beta-lactamase superfamily)